MNNTIGNILSSKTPCLSQLTKISVILIYNHKSEFHLDYSVGGGLSQERKCQISPFNKNRSSTHPEKPIFKGKVYCYSFTFISWLRYNFSKGRKWLGLPI